MSQAPRNLLTVWADLLLDTLAHAGIRDVVASPGSRSTPFLLAAARHRELALHTVVDERSAAFMALGMARATGRPPVLLCTSGSAPAHYFPAVVEASEAALPLIVLSADRPTELRGRGAPQTTDQLDLYGRHARFARDLGDPDASDGALRKMVRAVRKAVSVAVGDQPGPVQLNAPARKPLEPVQAESDDERDLVERAKAIRVRPATQSIPPFDYQALESVREALDAAERPAIVAGPLPVDDGVREAVFALARRSGLTLLAEATSQLRFVPRDGVEVADGFDWWLTHTSPDAILELGDTPTTGTYLRWLRTRPKVKRFVLGGSRFRDPSRTASAVVLGELAPMLNALDIRRSEGATPFAAAETQAWEVVDRFLAQQPELSEASAVQRVIGALKAGTYLALGNSLPIRHADRFVRGGGPALHVLSQRGTNGIDGWIAGTAGAALATRAPTVAVLGDVTVTHDVSSLSLAARVQTPLVLVVLDNGGGRIFEQLPIADHDIDMTLFTTPNPIDLEAATRAFGVRFAEASDAGGLDRALEAALRHAGATLLRVVLPPHGAATQLRAIRAALEEAR